MKFQCRAEVPILGTVNVYGDLTVLHSFFGKDVKVIDNVQESRESIDESGVPGWF